MPMAFLTAQDNAVPGFPFDLRTVRVDGNSARPDRRRDCHLKGKTSRPLQGTPDQTRVSDNLPVRGAVFT